MKKIESLFETPWFCVEAETLTSDFDLNMNPFYRIKVPDSVVVLAQTPENKLILVRQYRPAIKHHTLELPAGCIDNNESPLNAAVREMYEETGYQCHELQFVGIGGGAVDRLQTDVYLYYSPLATLDPNFTPEPGIEVLTITISEFMELSKNSDYLSYPALGALLLTQWKLHPTGLNLNL